MLPRNYDRFLRRDEVCIVPNNDEGEVLLMTCQSSSSSTAAAVWFYDPQTLFLRSHNYNDDGEAALCLTAVTEKDLKLRACSQQPQEAQQWIFSNFNQEGLSYSDLHYDWNFTHALFSHLSWGNTAIIVVTYTPRCCRFVSASGQNQEWNVRFSVYSFTNFSMSLSLSRTLVIRVCHEN